MSRDRGAYAVAALAVLARVALAWYGWAETLAGRVELTSPADSVLRLREGQALAALDQSPYAGSMLHAPPLVLLLLGPLTRDVPAGLPAVAPSSSRTLSPRSPSSRSPRASPERPTPPATPPPIPPRPPPRPRPRPRPRPAPRDPRRWRRRTLANPMTVASCVACSTAGMKHLALVASCVAAVDGEVALAGAAFAAFAYLAGPPAALLFSPVALLLARGGVGGEHRDGGDDTLRRRRYGPPARWRRRHGPPAIETTRIPGFELPRVHPTQSIHPTRSIPRAPRPRRVDRVVVRRVDRGVRRGGRASRRDDVGVDARATYGFLLRAEDLTPNLGLYWYFFAEIFDDFRAFSCARSRGSARSSCCPRWFAWGETDRYFASSSRKCATATAPYPTFGDVAGHLAMLPLFAEPLSGYRGGPLVAGAYAFVGILAPIFWRLWIESRGGQRQFFLRRHARARRVRTRRSAWGARTRCWRTIEGGNDVRGTEARVRREARVRKDSIEEVLRRETRESTFRRRSLGDAVSGVTQSRVVTRGRSDRSGFSSCG